MAAIQSETISDPLQPDQDSSELEVSNRSTQDSSKPSASSLATLKQGEVHPERRGDQGQRVSERTDVGIDGGSRQEQKAPQAATQSQMMSKEVIAKAAKAGRLADLVKDMDLLTLSRMSGEILAITAARRGEVVTSTAASSTRNVGGPKAVGSTGDASTTSGSQTPTEDSIDCSECSTEAEQRGR